MKPAFPLFLAGALLLSGCDDAPKDVSPITRIPGLPGPGAPPLDMRGPSARTPPPSFLSEPERLPEPAVEPVAVEQPEPSPKELSGPFAVHLNSGDLEVRFTGTAASGTASVINAKAETWAAYKLDAAASGKLLKSLDALRWWKLLPAAEPSRDLTLDVVRGDFKGSFDVRDAAEVTRLLTHFASGLGAKARQKFPATSVETFKPPKVVGVPKSASCEAQQKVFACDQSRCFAQGKLLACFAAPFKDKGTLVKRAAHSTEQPAVKNPDYFWALELKNGRTCQGAPLPTATARWVCGDEQVERLLHSDDAYFVVLGKSVVPVAKAWR
jgi:hypothetical protein